MRLKPTTQGVGGNLCPVFVRFFKRDHILTHFWGFSKPLVPHSRIVEVRYEFDCGVRDVAIHVTGRDLESELLADLERVEFGAPDAFNDLVLDTHQFDDFDQCGAVDQQAGKNFFW